MRSYGEADPLFRIIESAIRDHPRSQQLRIGPSEIGHPCPRFLLHKLNEDTPRRQNPAYLWRATVGTAVHAWLEQVFDKQNNYVVETEVVVGIVNGVAITGKCDNFAWFAGHVWDWKTASRSRLDYYSRKGPSPQYRVQAHAYGQGFANKGCVVTRVGNIYLPRDGDLADAHVWSEPFDPSIVQAALDKLTDLDSLRRAVGIDAALALFPTFCDEEFCDWCKYERAPIRVARKAPPISELMSA